MTEPFSGHVDVPVAGGDLRVALSGPPSGAPTALLVHGITGSHRGFSAVAEALGDDVRVIAPDLRGRGASNGLGVPFGIASHVADMVAVLDFLEVDRATLVGHSMGACVVARLAADHPKRAGTVVLVDGGLRVPLPEGADPDATLTAVLGPALARLKRTFPSRDAYVEFWRAHPAFSRPGAWTDHVAAYVDYDLEGEAPDLRSRVREGPVWADGRELMTDPAVHSATLEVTNPVLLLRAPRDLVDQPRPLIPDEVVAEFAERLPNLAHEMVPDTNHYLITLGDREAALVAGRVRDAAGAG